MSEPCVESNRLPVGHTRLADQFQKALHTHSNAVVAVFKHVPPSLRIGPLVAIELEIAWKAFGDGYTVKDHDHANTIRRPRIMEDYLLQFPELRAHNRR